VRALLPALCILIGAPALEASADRLVESPTLGPRLKLSTKIQANLNQYTNDAAFQLSNLTMGMLDMRFDLQSKRARLNLGGGDPDSFRLHLDSDVLIGKGRARIQARVELAIAGHSLEVEVPDLDLDTENVSGERAVMLSLPLVEGNF
jgi:hypothetical protein